MTFREFCDKKPVKSSLLRWFLGYVCWLAVVLSYYWIFDRDYLAQNGFSGILVEGAIMTTVILFFPALFLIGLNERSTRIHQPDATDTERAPDKPRP